jgi:LuxR family transcriptional regulator, maltose regulon positive regulatory protein
MPQPLRYALIWSHEHQHYTLTRDGQPEQGFLPADQSAFVRWLEEHTAFAFLGQAGRISVLKEARRGGTGYWYAHRTQHRHTRKCYLGRTAQVTFARLEEVAQRLTSSSSPAALAPAKTALLSSKLAPPQLPISLVQRSRLLDELEAVYTYPLTLVSASAGSGKTTLLSAWVASCRQSERLRAAGREPAVAWLSLEAFDNDPICFWDSVIAAVRTCLPRVGKAALAMLHQPQTPPLSTLLTRLLNEIEQGGRALILVLDDYHVISDQTIHTSLLFLIDHLPATLHLVLISRTDPELPLSRLRVRGQMVEIRSADLRFTQAEATHFLVQRMGLPLTEADVATLHQRTEGWIAGLHLAALSLRKQEDCSGWISDFAGSYRYLLDYVQQDILAGSPVALQHFLLQTSILTRMNAAACQAITASPTLQMSQQMLEEVERANLFVVPLDEQRQWYRYHDLFREVLLSTLHTSHPEMVPLLHRRAADFYEAHGQWHEAITHALLARDYSTAARLMEQTVEQFWLHGEAATIVRWVLALPEPLVREHACLTLTVTLYLLNTVGHPTGEQRARVFQQARQLMTRVETTLRDHSDETGRQISAPHAHADAGAAFSPAALEVREASDARLYRRLRLLHLCLVFSEARASGDYERFRSMRAEIEEELDPDEETIWQIVPLWASFMLSYLFWQAGAKLFPQLLSAKERVSQSGSPFASLKVRQYLAAAAVEAGHLHLAYQESQAALDWIEQIEGYALLKGYFQIVLAQVLYQWNRLEEARSRLHTVVQDAAAWQHLNLLGRGYADLMQVALARGEWSEAEQALHEVEHLVLREHSADSPRWLPVLRAQWWLAQGQLKTASDWAVGGVFPRGAWEYHLYAAFPIVIRVYFAELRFLEATELLERWHPHLDRPTNIRITLTYLAQLLVALHQAGRREQAHEIAVRLFALTEPEGYLRVYLNEGEPMREALQALFIQHHEVAASTTTYIAKLLAAFEQEEQTRAPLVDQSEIPPESRATDVRKDGGASLSRQELRVLRLLVAGQTYAEMAEALMVSSNTIKTQVSSIYRKLGVSRRAEAIAKTGQLHLL